MKYRVEALAGAAGISVDTVRFYQTRDLLPGPRRVGRTGIYGDAHLERLRRIRHLQDEGFTLKQIRRVLDAEGDDPEPLLAALVEESIGTRTLGRSELAAQAGIPEALIRAGETAGLIEPTVIDGEDRFGESDVDLVRAALAILDAGVPLQELLDPAIKHARNIDALCDAAIDLFDDNIRKQGPAADDPEAIAKVFQTLLPQATKLVALHFQRTLVSRALARLRQKGDHDALELALSAIANAREKLPWG